MSLDSPRYRPLTDTQVDRYHEMGILFPLRALSPDEQQSYRNAVKELETLLEAQSQPTIFGQCHLNFKWAFDLSTHPHVLDAVEQIIGPDILVHSTTLFSKRPGGCFVSWHQDSHYWGLSEPRLVSAWIALSASNVENGCLRVQPRTHLRQLDHAEIHHKHNMLSTGTTVQVDFDEQQAVDVVLRAGEMSLHHANIVHGSSANRSTGNRVGFAVRYLAPEVRQDRGHHEVVLARGRDRYGHYEHLSEPPVHSVRAGLPFHIAFSNRLRQRNLDRLGPPDSP